MSQRYAILGSGLILILAVMNYFYFGDVLNAKGPLNLRLRPSASLSVVIVTRALQRGYVDNLYRSLLAKVKVSELREVVFIVPDEEIQYFRRSLDENVNRSDFVVYADSQCFSESTRGQVNLVKSGWLKQQLVKLAASSLMKSDFYLVMDSDNLFVRSTSVSDLINDEGRAITDMHRVREDDTTTLDWLSASAEALNIRGEYKSLLVHGSVISVTPQILSVAIAQSLISRLDVLSAGQGWVSYLLDRSSNSTRFWTEYMLYHSHAVHSGMFRLYHEPGKTKQVSIWSKTVVTKPLLDSIFNESLSNPRGHFSLIQSNRWWKWNETAEDVWRMIASYYPPAVHNRTMMSCFKCPKPP